MDPKKKSPEPNISRGGSGENKSGSGSDVMAADPGHPVKSSVCSTVVSILIYLIFVGNSYPDKRIMIRITNVGIRIWIPGTLGIIEFNMIITLAHQEMRFVSKIWIMFYRIRNKKLRIRVIQLGIWLI